MGILKYTVIKTEEQYYEYCDLLEEIDFSDEAEEREDEIELLTLLIKAWDDEHRLTPELDPVQLIKSLMEDHKLSQNDLAEIAGVGKSYISEILNYKKRMSKTIIRNFAEHFKIQQEALNKRYRLEGEGYIDEGEFYSTTVGESSGSEPIDFNELLEGLEIESGTNYTLDPAA